MHDSSVFSGEVVRLRGCTGQEERGWLSAATFPFSGASCGALSAVLSESGGAGARGERCLLLFGAESRLTVVEESRRRAGLVFSMVEQGADRKPGGDAAAPRVLQRAREDEDAEAFPPGEVGPAFLSLYIFFWFYLYTYFFGWSSHVDFGSVGETDR